MFEFEVYVLHQTQPKSSSNITHVLCITYTTNTDGKYGTIAHFSIFLRSFYHLVQFY